jgi:hypothetical protein
MNKIKVSTALLLLFAISHFKVFAQAPQGIPYQAIARNSSGVILAGQTIRVRFSIRDSIATGTIVYRETFSPTTTTQGLFNVNVGTGTVVSGTFSGVNWGHNAKHMQVEMDPAGGTSYIDMGTQQMMSVPYALYAGNTSGLNHHVGELFGGGIIFDLWKDSLGTEHGLIASSIDLNTNMIWCNLSGTSGSGPTFALSYINGSSNTNEIIEQSGHVSSAAQLCRSYNGGGFTDWYLPSVLELKIFITQFPTITKKVQNEVTGSNAGEYWSSTAQSGDKAYALDLFGNLILGYKSTQHLVVRAIRSF